MSGAKHVVLALFAIGMMVAPSGAFAKAEKTAAPAEAPATTTAPKAEEAKPAEGEATEEAEKVTQKGEGSGEERAAESEHAAETPEDHAAANAHAAPALPKQDWSFNGPLGTYDRASLQRGFQVYKQVCAACHGMKRVAYRNLADLGYSEAQIKTVAAEYTFMDGPNDEGEMFERPGKPSDHFKSPYANDNAAKANNNGALPPDLSLITKARAGGADYIYAILTGYEEAPAGADLAVGQHWNRYMAGNKIAMPAPLADGAVPYEDGSPTTVAQYAHDVSTFLTWAAEPEMEHRKQTGLKVLIFLAVFAGLMYAVKKKIWSNVH